MPRPAGLAPPEPADRADEGNLVGPSCHRPPGYLVSGLRVKLGLGKVLVMRVFVAGGTGVVGRRLVSQLVARGHHVTATATGPGKLGMLEQVGADAVVMDGLDGLDGVSVGEAVAAARPDVIVHQMTAIVLAVERQARGVYNIVDDEPAPASEWLPCLAACAGAKPPVRLPKWLARLLAGEVAATMMTEGRGFSNAKAKRELGWTLRHPSWRQGFKAVMA